jgi:GR25 family glycosyltransferase involved in LPS biosynthesis
MLKIIAILSLLTPLTAYIENHLTPVSHYLTQVNITETNSGLKYVDCLYVINLDHRTEKWAKAKKAFNKQKCYPNRVSAINGWQLPPSAPAELMGPYFNHPIPPNLKGLTPGGIGCLLSHVSIYKDAFNRGLNTIWICEDDIKIIDKLEKIDELIKNLNRLDPNWDVLYTDFTTNGTDIQQPRPNQPNYLPIKRRRVIASETLLRTHGRFQTHSMILSRRGIEKALNYFTHVYLYAPIDIDLHYIPSLREYSTKKDLVTFNKNSTLSDTEKSDR